MRHLRRALIVVAALLAMPQAIAPAAAVSAVSVVIGITDGTLEVVTSDQSTVTTRIEIAVYDYAGDSDSGPSPTGTATGQTCTITPPAGPSSPWSGACSITGVSAQTWLAVKATAYVGANPSSPVDSNQVYWAGPWEPDDERGPMDLMQAVRRATTDDCSAVDDARFAWGTGLAGGWSPSWAEWANGPVCVRTLSPVASGWRLR